MVWLNHASSLEDAKKQFGEAREAYIKAKAEPLSNPNYFLDLKDAEEKMRLQFDELNAWKERAKKPPTTYDIIGQLQKNAFSHPDPTVRANCQSAMQHIAGEFLKEKPQDFQDAVRVITELKMLQLMNLGKTWTEVEASSSTPKHRALCLTRKYMVEVVEHLKKEDPSFDLTPALELAMITRYLELMPPSAKETFRTLLGLDPVSEEIKP